MILIVARGYKKNVYTMVKKLVLKSQLIDLLQKKEFR